MPAVYLVRHAQASFGTHDYDRLSPNGWRQVAALGGVLGSRLPAPDVLVSGTMRRQVETMDGALPGTGWQAPVRRDARWNEYDHAGVGERYGAERGFSSDDPQEMLEESLRHWMSGGAGGGETFTQFRARVDAAVDELAGSLGRGRNAVVVTSGGVIAAVAARVFGMGPEGFLAVNRVVANGGITTLAHGRRGLSLLTLNDHGHFTGELRTFR
jgi:broad specificity phosphatase PhoE